MPQVTTDAAVADYACHTGEGPLWHPEEQRLYFVDIPDGELYRFNPATGAAECVYHRAGEGEVIGGFTIQADGTLLLFEEGGRVEVFDHGATATVLEGIEGEADSRFNDVIADPRGRVFCGTMPTEDRDGALYRLDTDGSVTQIRDDVGLPNGMGFAPDREGFYFTDSPRGEILRYDYEEATGALSNPETVVDLSEEAGIPDGMTVDAGGDIWSARWDGSCLVRYSPAGVERERVEFPAKKVSSVILGGREYVDAYVTTALGPGEGETNPREVEGEGAGMLFRTDLGVRGVSEFFSRVGL